MQDALPCAGERPGTGAENLLLGLKASGNRLHIRQLRARTSRPSSKPFATLDGDRVPMSVTVPHETAGVGNGARLFPRHRPGAGGDWFTLMWGWQFGHGRHQCRQRQRAGGHDVGAYALDRGQPGGRARDADPVRPGNVRPVPRWSPMLVKFHYEMRYAEQGDMLALRATTLAMSEPRGPVYSQPAARTADGGACPKRRARRRPAEAGDPRRSRPPGGGTGRALARRGAIAADRLPARRHGRTGERGHRRRLPTPTRSRSSSPS